MTFVYEVVRVHVGNVHVGNAENLETRIPDAGTRAIYSQWTISNPSAVHQGLFSSFASRWLTSLSAASTSSICWLVQPVCDCRRFASSNAFSSNCLCLCLACSICRTLAFLLFTNSSCVICPPRCMLRISWRLLCSPSFISSTDWRVTSNSAAWSSGVMSPRACWCGDRQQEMKFSRCAKSSATANAGKQRIVRQEAEHMTTYHLCFHCVG